MYAMMTTSSGGYGLVIRVFANGPAGHLHIIEIGPAGHEGRIALDLAALSDLHAKIGAYLAPIHEARLEELKAQPSEEEHALLVIGTIGPDGCVCLSEEPPENEGEQWRGSEAAAFEAERMAEWRKL